MTNSVELFPIAIGEFDADRYPRIDGIEANLAAITETFSDFECHLVEWPRTAPSCCRHAPAEQIQECSACPDRKGDHYRNHDDVDSRLRQWADRDSATRSILYWVGHGSSDDEHPTLIHSRTSPQYADTEGIRPERIADAIAGRFVSSPRPWVIVMIEACRSMQFVSLLQNALNLRRYQGSYLLISPTSSHGAVKLGHLQALLHNILHKTFATEDVLLDRFAKALHSRDVTVKQGGPIPDDVVAFVRRIRLPANISVDAREELARAIETLPMDIQRHFITKAHGGLGSFEQVLLNEQSWYFEGREDDTRRVVSWLQDRSSGMLVVTGAPGSGKSAFLGNLIVHANPALREALHHAGLLAEVPKGLPDNVFDVCLTLTGAPSDDVIAKLAAAVEAEIPDDVAGRDIADTSRWLTQTIRGRGTPITIVVDALDEAVFPEELANYLLRPLGQLPNIRLIVGTRKSTDDQIDRTTADRNLLNALGVSDRDIVTIQADHGAIQRFVAHRLRNRVSLDVDRFAVAVAQRDPHFLMAQLAVHEVVSDPRWHSEHTWDYLLRHNHNGMFGLAVARLHEKHSSYRALLMGLAFSSGHGLPIHDGVWRTVAQAIKDLEKPRSGVVTDDLIESFLDDAAPYVIVDNEHHQTVYRFSHRTFAEHFIGSGEAKARRELAIARGLISATNEALDLSEAASIDATVNPYVRQYLSTHVANAGESGWNLLADNERLITMLNPEQIGADAQRTAFGRFPLPSIVEGIANASERLSRVARESYPVAVALATARMTGRYSATHTRANGEKPPVDLHWAAVQRRMYFRALTGHTDSVLAFATIPAPNGHSWLASAGREGVIRVWNPVTAQPIKVLRGHVGAVTALTVFLDPNVGTVLVSSGEDATIGFWDVVSGKSIGTMTGRSRVTVLAAIPYADGRILLACASLNTIEVRDAANGSTLGVFSGHSDAVTALTVLPNPYFGNVIASAAKDGTFRLWNPETGRTYSAPKIGPVAALTTLLLSNAAWPTLACAERGGVSLWDPTDADGNPYPRLIRRLSSSHGGLITALASLHLPGRGPQLAGVGQGTIDVWDPAQPQPISSFASRSGDTHAITALAAVPLADGGSLLASANYHLIRLWNPIAGQRQPSGATGAGRLARSDGAGRVVNRSTKNVTALAAVQTADGESLVATAGYDDSVDLWDAENGKFLGSLGHPTDRAGRVTALACLPTDDGRAVLASGGNDGVISLWSPAAGQHPIIKLPSHSHEVTAFALVRTSDRITLLASADRGGVVVLWDPVEQRLPIAKLPSSHPITALSSIPDSSRGALLACADDEGAIRVFDPMDLAAGQPIKAFSGGAVAVRALAVIVDAGHVPMLASAHQDGTIHLFDLANSDARQPIARLSGHSGAVTAVAAFPVTKHRTILLSAGRDGTVRLWDPQSGAQLHMLPLDVAVSAILVLPNGHIAVGLDDGLLVLDIDVSKVARRDP
ncbi:WD40 repeat domain-containing protein [Nocardia brasiliensis]|uniref:WD40 repeat domain-containing protein n=1 Tax=Nocardia brasiliensis TaxID=37326 RepID=UPI003672D854